MQAGENVGLQNSLGVTTEDNTYENPFDSSRRIFYTYDFWHALKNLRYQSLTLNNFYIHIKLVHGYVIKVVK